MSASACLRIILDLSDEKLARLDALGPLVAKVTSAFLETRWSWPKRFETLNPYCFMLIDPRAREVDVARLERLAGELQVKLFGTSEAGDVTLLLFGGGAADTARFVQMDHATLCAMTREPLGPLPFTGQLLKISTAGDAPPGLQWRSIVNTPGAAARDSAGRDAARAGEASFRGVYFTPKQTFVGCGVSADGDLASLPHSIVDGVAMLPREHEEAFDMAALEAGRRHLADGAFTGVMFLPVCFSSLMRRSTRAAYETQFQALPLDRRRQLAAVVYDSPRAPAFHVLMEIRALLERNFSIIDLQVADAGFEIDSVQPDVLNSVTFRLPDADERTRLASLRRFMEKRDSYKRLRIWPAVTNVRTRSELEACSREHVPFITGAAVCGPMSAPVGSLPWDVGQLPLAAAA